MHSPTPHQPGPHRGLSCADVEGLLAEAAQVAQVAQVAGDRPTSSAIPLLERPRGIDSAITTLTIDRSDARAALTRALRTERDTIEVTVPDALVDLVAAQADAIHLAMIAAAHDVLRVAALQAIDTHEWTDRMHQRTVGAFDSEEDR